MYFYHQHKTRMWKHSTKASITPCPPAISSYSYPQTLYRGGMQTGRAPDWMHRRIMLEQKIPFNFIAEKGFKKAGRCCNGLFPGKGFISCTISSFILVLENQYRDWETWLQQKPFCVFLMSIYRRVCQRWKFWDRSGFQIWLLLLTEVLSLCKFLLHCMLYLYKHTASNALHW